MRKTTEQQHNSTKETAQKESPPEKHEPPKLLGVPPENPTSLSPPGNSNQIQTNHPPTDKQSEAVHNILKIQKQARPDAYANVSDVEIAARGEHLPRIGEKAQTFIVVLL